MSEVRSPETLGFQAEVKQLLHLMVHSLYGNKEIFLRELVSNASDACDKLRFEALADTALWETDPDLKIRVAYDKAPRTVTVSDNGVGMSRDEVIANIGTIAKSGTREFFQSLTGDQAKDAHLIGQFGVGFYSSFIVAAKVTLVTRRAGMTAEHGVRWESDGGGQYTLETITRERRGTEVTLHLREGEDELLSGFRLRSILRKYSDHITIPILMKKERLENDVDKDKNEPALKEQEEQINQASALWARPKSEITEEQYQEFYKHVGHDFEAPLAWTHAHVEGKQEYTLLLYLPAHAPFDLWDREHRHGVKLYVQRVFIMDDEEKEDETVALADYVSRMKEGQDKIYYITADSFGAARSSPHLEIFRKKGVEVLLMHDRIDEWVMAHLTEFEGKKLLSVAKGDLDLGKLEDEAEKKEQEKEAGEFKELTDKIG